MIDSAERPSAEALRIAKDFEYHCERNPEEGLATAYVARVIHRALTKKFEDTREAAARLMDKKAKTERTSYPQAVIKECAEEVRAMQEPQ